MHLKSSLLMSLLVVLHACSSGSGPSIPNLALGEGHPDPLAVGEGEARAGTLEASEIPVDPTGLSTMKAGHFVLANSRIAVVIEAKRDSDYYDPWGGKIGGFAVMKDGAMVQSADYSEALVLIGRYTVEPEQVGVLNDGSNGEAAVVRAIGPMKAVPALNEIGKTFLPDDYDQLRVAYDYILEPDADYVDVRLTVEVTSGGNVSINHILSAFYQAERMPPFIETAGFDVGEVGNDEKFPYIAFIEESASSYAATSSLGSLQVYIPLVSGFSTYSMPLETNPLPAKELSVINAARFVVGSKGLDGLKQAYARMQGDALREVIGSVKQADDAPAVGSRVYALDESGALLSRTLVDADGNFALHVPSVPVTLKAWRLGNNFSNEQSLASDENTAALSFSGQGTLNVTVHDADNNDLALPSRVQVLPAASTVMQLPPASYGEKPPHDGRLHLAFPSKGQVSLPVAAGEYDVRVSRGYEYDLWQNPSPIEVQANETVDVEASLNRVVETPGVMCADYHIHTYQSVDSPDDPEVKVKGAVADGLEILVRSDHEWVSDFAPVIAALDESEGSHLADFAFGVPSEELTTFEWGHFGVLPLQPNPDG
ncbi:MAG: hypothetical protein IPJ88_11680 [Myxococcales bacterium]|nr:MAG: hypothetical protein IPJ88_11680 [Myxococcales bacterium]